MSRAQFFQISCKIEISPYQIYSKNEHISKIFKLKGKSENPYTGKGLFSLVLPNDLNYESDNKAHQLKKLKFTKVYCMKVSLTKQYWVAVTIH